MQTEKLSGIVWLEAHALPGLGSGIRRALKEEPALRLENDTDGERFIASIPRAAV